MITYALPPGSAFFSPQLWRALGKELFRVLRYRHRRQAGIAWVGLEEMRRLNAQYRHKDRPTDVLSFEAEQKEADGERYMGDLVICQAYAKEEAVRRGIPVKEEILRLVIHGTLHLAGQDHATLADEARMFGVQERVLSRILELCPRY
jgi:probable rRNA maturation factor